jgi:hypothetical protein
LKKLSFERLLGWLNFEIKTGATEFLRKLSMRFRQIVFPLVVVVEAAKTH